MQMLIDQLVIDERPDLIEALEHLEPRCVVAPFEYLAAAVSIADAINDARPDLIVIDAVWLHLSALFQRILQINKCWPTPVLVASTSVDDVFRVQVAHRSFAGHVDLQLPIERLVTLLCDVAHRDVATAETHLWTTVPLPAVIDDISDTATDHYDREILDLVSVGMQDADIAAVIHLSPQTVKNRISAMLERSGLRNRTQLAWMHTNSAVGDAVTRSLKRRGAHVGAV